MRAATETGAMADISDTSAPVSSPVESARTPATRATEQPTREGFTRRVLLNAAGVVGGTVLAGALLPGNVALAQAAPPSLPAPLIAGRISLMVSNGEPTAFADLLGITLETQGTTSGGPLETKSPTITLKRGATGNMDLWKWYELTRLGAPGFRKDAVLSIWNDTATSLVMKYSLTQAWPSKLELDTLKSGSTEILLEVVTFTCERLQRTV
jgi:phage tail-like protein